MKLSTCAVALLAMMASTAALAADNFPGLKDSVVIIIRHAEKPETGYGLTAAGEARAAAYPNFFKNLTLDGQPANIDYLVAAADSKNSHRPRLTIEPTSKALGLKIDSRFASKDFAGLAKELAAKPHGKTILVAWHHGDIPELAEALGAKPTSFLANGKWPDTVFGWMIELRYDSDGKLVETKLINEKLMPDDQDSKEAQK